MLLLFCQQKYTYIAHLVIFFNKILTRKVDYFRYYFVLRHIVSTFFSKPIIFYSEIIVNYRVFGHHVGKNLFGAKIYIFIIVDIALSSTRILAIISKVYVCSSTSALFL